MKDLVSERVIGAGFEVNKKLGFGYLESVYENALAVELNERNVPFEQQKKVMVYYRDQVVGEFICDLIVNGRLIVELKSVAKLTTVHEVQLVNYLNSTRTDDGLLINFGPEKVEVKRKFRQPPFSN